MGFYFANVNYGNNTIKYKSTFYKVIFDGISISLRSNLHKDKEKQRVCPLFDANKHTHIYIKYICI